MLKSLYEFEKRDRTIYDRMHEYCLVEKVNEEQLRVSVIKIVRMNYLMIMGILFGYKFYENE